MKKARAGVIAATVSALALVASPAKAGPGDPVGCFQSPDGGPTQNAVRVNGLDVTVAPGALPEDATSAQAFALAVATETYVYAWCVEGGTYDSTDCWRDKIFPTEHVEHDPNSHEVQIHGNEIVAETGASCPMP